MKHPVDEVSLVSRLSVGAVVAALSLIAGWLIFLPLAPGMPAAGLDPSWQIALNVAVAKGLVFGRDVIFTFGPLASLYTKLYSPETDHIMMAGSAIYGAALCAILVLSTYPRRLVASAAIPVLLSLSPPQDPYFIAMPFLLLLNVARCCLPEKSTLYLKPGFTVILTLALSTIATGMAPIVKASFLGVAAPISVLVALLLTYKNMAASLAFSALLIGSTCIWWIVCGQPIGDLPRMFIAQSPVISGYTEAMSLTGSWFGPISYFIVSIFLCFRLTSLLKDEKRLITGIIVFAAAWTLFVAFKAGFVRNDGHGIIAAGVLVLMAYAIACLSTVSTAVTLICTSGIVAFLVVWTSYQGYRPQKMFESAVSRTVSGIAIRFRNSSSLQNEYAAAIGRMRDLDPLPAVPGTVDVYPTDLSAIFANKDRWSGRPVFQSYSAYTPALLELNAKHLSGPGAPDDVFFTFGPIDNRLPTSEDSNSLLTLLSQYKIVGYANSYVHMEKASPNGTHLINAETRGVSISLNQEVPIDEQRPVWLRVDVKPTLLSRLLNTAFKPPQLEIDLTLADGSIARHRFIPGMAESGFLVSPYLTTGSDLVRLAAGLDGRTVKSFKIVSGRPYVWGGIEVKMTPIQIAPQDGAHDIVFAKESDLPSPLPAEMTETPCSIDYVNGKKYDGAASRRSALSISGWIFPKSKAQGFNTWIVITSATGRKRYFKPSQIERPDVASVYKRADVADSGFDITIDASHFDRPQTIEILSTSSSIAFKCSSSIHLD